MHRAVTIEMHLAAWQEHKRHDTPTTTCLCLWSAIQKKDAPTQRLGQFRKNAAMIEND